MNITFIGVGSAFTTSDYFQSNLLITAATGRKMLIDCGTDARFALQHLGIHSGNLAQEIDAVYISHVHADHVGGLEWLAFVTYFTPGSHQPTMFLERSLMPALWENSLRGGLEWVQSRQMSIGDYFNVAPLEEGTPFQWEGATFTPIRMDHIVVSPEKAVSSFGLIIQSPNSSAFFSSDTLFQPSLIELMAKRVDVIFHDCETLAIPSSVHSHYNELCTLPAAIKERMWLYHYHPLPSQDPKQDGFCGFVTKGQEFIL